MPFNTPTRHWSLNESSAGVGEVERVDSVAAVHLFDTTWIPSAAGILGNAVNLTGSIPSTLWAADSAELRTGNVDQTFAGLFKLTSYASGNATILAKVTLAGDHFEYIIDVPFATHKLRFLLGNGNTGFPVILVSDDTISTATWYGFIAKFKASTGIAALKINNVTQTPFTKTADPGTSTGPLYVGVRPDAQSDVYGVTGLVDEIMLWNGYYTSDAEDAWLYNGGAWRTYAAIIAGIPATVATPAISPNGGTFTVPTEVTLTCATSGASIYYTTDGSTPDATDTLYTVPFTLSADATVKAIGIKAAMTDSAVASAAFTITIAAGTASRANGVMQICLTAETSNNRVPIRYVTAEHGVPVETVGAMAVGVVPCVESVDANAVPVVEVEAP